jgi:hypothetical protein
MQCTIAHTETVNKTISFSFSFKVTESSFGQTHWKNHLKSLLFVFHRGMNIVKSRATLPLPQLYAHDFITDISLVQRSLCLLWSSWLHNMYFSCKRIIEPSLLYARAFTRDISLVRDHCAFFAPQWFHNRHLSCKITICAFFSPRDFVTDISFVKGSSCLHIMMS